MPMERQVISVRYLVRFGREVPKYEFDYSSVEVGDWFIAEGKARIRSANASVASRKIASAMTFEREPHRERSMKYTRIS